MTHDDIIRMAREAGATPYTNRHLLDRPFTTFSPEALERFVTMAASAAIAAEREACAKVCDDNDTPAAIWSIPRNCAAAIRARSQQPEKHTPCAGKPTNNSPSPGAWEFYQPCHHCQRRLSPGGEPRQPWYSPPDFVDGVCPSRIGVES